MAYLKVKSQYEYDNFTYGFLFRNILYILTVKRENSTDLTKKCIFKCIKAFVSLQISSLLISKA